MAATTATANFVYPLAGVMTAQIAGFQVSTILVGMGLYWFGIVARCGYEIQTSAQGGDGMKLSKLVGWAAGGVGTAPFGTVLGLLLFKFVFHMPVDGPVIILCGPIGFGGPGILLYILNMGVGVLNKQFNLGIPTFPQKKAGQP